MLPVGLAERLGVVVGCAEIEGVVDGAVFPSPLPFVLPGRFRRGGGHGVGHFHIGGHAAVGCCTALAAYRRLVRHARLAKVDVLVDDARQHIASCRVDDVVVVVLRQRGFRPDGGNASVVAYGDGALYRHALIDEGAVFDQRAHDSLCLYIIGIGEWKSNKIWSRSPSGWV